MSARAPPASARATPPTSGGLPRELEPPAPQAPAARPQLPPPGGEDPSDSLPAAPRMEPPHRFTGTRFRDHPQRGVVRWFPLGTSNSRTRFGWKRGTSGPRWGPGTINLLPGQSGWGGGGGCRGRRRAARRKRGRSHSITSGWVCRAVRRELRRRRAIHLYHVRNAGCGWRRRPASPCAGRRGTLDWDVDMRDATIPRVTGNCGR